MAREKSTKGPGIIGLVAKVGAKTLPIALKLLKGVKALKLALAAASFAAYAALFTWQFSAMIIVMLFVHESGHIWAMRRSGMRTKGIYFIPFMGGVALGDDDFPSRKAEVFIAIMGPIWGFTLALVTGGAYLLTKDPMLAAASSWMALINLFNLLPINPLDGGRIMKNVAFSLHTRVGFLFMIAGFALACVLAWTVGLYLVLFLSVLGGIEVAYDYFNLHRADTLTVRELASSVASYLVVAGVLFGLMYLMEHEPGAALALKTLQS